jgi:hypothetical protein
MQLTRHSSDYREIDWEQLRLVNHCRLVDFAGQGLVYPRAFYRDLNGLFCNASHVASL